MNKIIASIVVASIAIPSASSFAKRPKSWEEILNNPKIVKSPVKEDVYQPAIAPSSDYRLFPVGDRFVFLFDPSGYPVVAFDLTIEPNSWRKMVLGAFGIGQWSIRNIWHRYKKAKENPNELLNHDEVLPEGFELDQVAADERRYQNDYDRVDAEERRHVPRSDIKRDKERGYKAFARVKFTDKFVQANKTYQVDMIEAASNPRSGFKPLSFTMGDLHMTDRQREKVLPVMNELSQLIFKKELTAEELPSFLSQFKMNWNEETEEFNAAWEPVVSNFEKRKPLPGWVLNYQNPLDILAFKYGMHNIERMMVNLEFMLPQEWHLLGILAARMANGIKAQLDQHEGIMQELLESSARGEYALNIPLQNPDAFIDASITMLYLNKMIDTDEITNGWKKRQLVTEEEAKERKANYAWLQKKKFEISAWPGNRIATVTKNGKIKNIVNLVMPKNFFSRTPSFHYYGAAPWFKAPQRIGLELFTAAVRMVVPSYFVYRNGSFVFGMVLPSGLWDQWFRGRAYSELHYEGHILARVNERLNGRFEAPVPGFDDLELKHLRGTMYGQRQNPYAIPLSQEPAAKAAHHSMIKDFLGGLRGESIELNHRQSD